ncbi:ABC transporter permease [Fontibacillus sp. BL9]|uniref:ABC transporter permease n=1 Tax=Fontibacillus sp. BL9 TaxID=3389971 RepID=UPI00397C8F9F
MILPQKMFRDIWSAKAQFITIIIIVACGVFTFVGAITVGNRLEKSVTSFYDKTRINDIWINAKNIEDKDILNIKHLPGVEEAQGRNVLKVHSGNRSIELFILNENKLAQPFPITGEFFRSGESGIWLDREFALANAIEVGDTIEFTSDGNSTVKMTVKGLVMSPEKLIDISSETLSTRHDLYGYAFIGEQAARQSIHVTGYNQILLKVKAGADQQNIITQTETVLGSKYLNSITHDDHTSIVGAASQIAQFKTLAYVTPLLFFVLAVLVVASTMSRLISNQRIQIGTLMSLGFSARQIRWHYMCFGLFLGLTGSLIGMAAGYFGIPMIFMRTLTQSFILPQWIVSFPFESLFAIVAMCGCCILAVLMACGKKLKESPAAVLRGSIQTRRQKSMAGKASKARLSFENLWILRNLKAHKLRGFMGIIGAFGCAFLILFGFANIDSSNKSILVEFEQQYRYTYKADIQSSDAASLPVPGLAEDAVQYIQESRVQIKSDRAVRNLPVTVMGSGDYINLNHADGNSVTNSSEGIILSERTADVLGVKKGNKVKLKIADDEWRDVKVAETIKAPVANHVYVSGDTWEKMGAQFVVTSLLIGDQADLGMIKEQYPVTQIVSKEEMKNANLKLNEGVFASAAGLTIAAVFLGIAVIYSLGLINLTEMARELATLKVLGFNQREIRTLLSRENMILTLIGIVLAVPLGSGAIHALEKLSTSESIMLFPTVRISSYLIAVTITLLCSFAVNRLISRKVMQIDMVTSLKAID